MHRLPRDDPAKRRFSRRHEPDGVGHGLSRLTERAVAGRDCRRDIMHVDSHAWRDGAVGLHPDGRHRPLPEDRRVDVASHGKGSDRDCEIVPEPPPPPEEEEAERPGGKGRGRHQEEMGCGGEEESKRRDSPGGPGRPKHPYDTPALSMISPTTASGVTPAIVASRVRRIRCRRAGTASARASSGMT